MNYVLVNIGCIECGVDSDIVGVFDSKEKAENICETLSNDRNFSWRQGGQNRYEVFALPELNKIKEEYASK